MLRSLWCVPFINGIWFIFSCFRLQAFIRLFSSFYIIAEKEERNGKSCVSFVMLCKLLSEIFSFHISGKFIHSPILPPSRVYLNNRRDWLCIIPECAWKALVVFSKEIFCQSFGHLTSIPPTDFPINLIDLAFFRAWKSQEPPNDYGCG